MKKNTHSPLFRFTSFLLIAAMLHLSTGCNYYMYTTAASTAEGLEVITPDKYVIIHFQEEIWHLDRLTFDQDQKVLSGSKHDVTPEHEGHNNPTQKANRYRKNVETPTNEVHIYVNSFVEEENNLISIPYHHITRIDIYDKAMEATIASHLVTSTAIATVAAFTLLLIWAATKSSCPFVYIKDGETYHFMGEIYGGAISQNMERDDYMPLPAFEPADGLYDLKITNELKERQYTDIAELILVEHPQNVEVMLDPAGKLHTLSELIPPTLATTEKGKDLASVLQRKDSVSCLFLDSDTLNPDFSSVHLQFPKPADADEAKLLLRAKNTMWLDYIFGEFIAQFGNKYAAFSEDQKTVPAKQKRQWTINEGMLLAVKVKTSEGWQLVDHLNMVGPLAPRDLLIPIDLTDLEGDRVDIRLEGGLHFWELDYAAIDYSENMDLPLQTLAASYGTDEKGKDVRASLARVDGDYLEQPEIGNEAILHFEAPEKNSPEQDVSVFLHTRGYYEYIRDFQGSPRVAKLKKFREAGTFAQYSGERLQQFSNVVE